MSSEHEQRQIGVLQLIAAYRNRGHQKAKLDPLGLAKREDVPDLRSCCAWFNQVRFRHGIPHR